MKEKVKNLLLYGGTARQNFLNIYQDVTEANRKNVMVFSAIVAIGMLVMSLASFVDASLVKNRSAYISCAIICAVLFMLMAGIGRGRPKLIYAAVYVFIGLLFAFGIDLGTFVEPNEVTVSFTVILFAAPLLFTDRPVRMIIAIAAGILVYFYAASITQDPVMQGYNRSNVLPYGIISMIASTYMMAIKIRRYVLESENKKLLDTDRMTGMRNRRSYEHHIAQLRRDGVTQGMKFCAMDVNGLKAANDTVGHYAGDALICGAADCIEAVFGPFGQCYRTGGDEFMAILDAGAPDNRELWESLSAACDKFRQDGIPPLSLSLGIEEAEAEDDIDRLVREADRKMYDNKALYYARTGKGRRI